MNPLVHDAEYTMVMIKFPRNVYGRGVYGVYCEHSKWSWLTLSIRIVNMVQPVRVDGVMKSWKLAYPVSIHELLASSGLASDVLDSSGEFADVEGGETMSSAALRRSYVFFDVIDSLTGGVPVRDVGPESSVRGGPNPRRPDPLRPLNKLDGPREEPVAWFCLARPVNFFKSSIPTWLRA